MHALKKARRLAIVPRWSVLPTIRSETVASHTFQVVVLARLISKHHVRSGYLDFRDQITSEALNHDLDEAMDGDEPGGPWRKPKDYQQLIKERGQVWAVVKMADILDAYLFLTEEWLMGNTLIEPIIEGYRDELYTISQVIEWDEHFNIEHFITSVVKNSTGLSKGDYI